MDSQAWKEIGYQHQPFNSQFYKPSPTYWLVIQKRFDAQDVILKQSTI